MKISVLDINPILLKVVVWIHETLENKHDLRKYLSCWWVSDEQFSFKYFPKDAFAREISPKQSGLFCVIWE